MNDKERKENFRKISDDIILPLMLRSHCVSATYQRAFMGVGNNPATYFNEKNDETNVTLEFDPDTCAKGTFYFEALFPEDCEFERRAKTTIELSERIEETPYKFGAEEHRVTVSGDFNKDNIEEVKATILSVDDAVRALYE
ncbi:hypothetical protein KY338_01780 [Candidatus Woesearchaeota archaeon]|nr:hypothetical protein [Candidatus Woesearchaeota archaeon]MBW3005992.1 hypothetical protein [Candidatus Woesearchaeota archaeon]